MDCPNCGRYVDETERCYCGHRGLDVLCECAYCAEQREQRTEKNNAILCEEPLTPVARSDLPMKQVLDW